MSNARENIDIEILNVKRTKSSPNIEITATIDDGPPRIFMLLEGRDFSAYLEKVESGAATPRLGRARSVLHEASESYLERILPPLASREQTRAARKLVYALQAARAHAAFPALLAECLRSGEDEFKLRYASEFGDRP